LIFYHFALRQKHNIYFHFGNGKMTEVDQHMSKTMTENWINFTKTGNPNNSLKTTDVEYNCSKLPFWNPYKSN